MHELSRLRARRAFGRMQTQDVLSTWMRLMIQDPRILDEDGVAMRFWAWRVVAIHSASILRVAS